MERDIERHFVKACQNAGAVVRKAEWVGRAGCPDRIVLMPGGRVAFAELKDGDRGRLSPVQEHEIGVLRKLGFEVRVIRNSRDVAVFVHEILS